MRLQLILPRVNAAEITQPTRCQHCGGRYLHLHQTVDKPLRDTLYQRVQAQRYRCLECGRTFRVYPQGVTREQTSQRVKGLAVLLYLLGLSYGATALALEALGVYLCKSRVYDTVQAVAKRVPGLKREAVFQGIQTPVVGSDVTSVRCCGQWQPLGLAIDDTSGLVLSVDCLSGEDAQTLQAWMEPIVTAVGAQVMVSDDADSYKRVADELGLQHQVCKSHVERNTDALIESLAPAAARDEDGSLAAIQVSAQQAVADLDRLGQLIRSRQRADGSELGTIHQRYARAAPPREGERASLAYRVRSLFLDRWDLWPRLTLYRTWQGPDGQTIDGTNNGTERAIGWWVKERYRTMRGYKRVESAVNVSRLLTWCGNALGRGGADLGLLFG
jgi:transposase-like protein